MDQPNIILIVLDTLRKDVLPMYGCNAYTPNLTKYAKDAIVYPNPVAPSPWTLPSHMSIFTGFYSIEHGVHEDPNEGMNKNAKLQFEYINKTITHMLKEKGYTNIGFSANGWISETSIFADNFDYFLYQEHSLLSKKELDFIEKFYPFKIKKIISHPNAFLKLYKIYKNNKFKGWPLNKGGNYILQDILNASLPTPFFLFINFMEAHDPYTFYEMIRYYGNRYLLDLLGIKKFPKRIIKKMQNNYLKEVEILDIYIGELINYLKNIKQYDNSLIIITSDHAESPKINIYRSK